MMSRKSASTKRVCTAFAVIAALAYGLFETFAFEQEPVAARETPREEAEEERKEEVGKGERIIFEERFDHKLAEGWSWLREKREDWRIRRGALEILVRPGVAHNVKNALVRKAPDRNQGTFAIDVTVTNTTKPTRQYEQLGITWYRDKKPVFKLVKELVDGRIVIVPGFKPVEAKKVQLRVIVTADSFTAQYRPDAKGEFRTAATGRLPPPKNDQVSIQCYNGPPDEEHWMRFDDFRIVELRE